MLKEKLKKYYIKIKFICYTAIFPKKALLNIEQNNPELEENYQYIKNKHIKYFDELASQVIEFSENKKIIYVSNRGNYGDALIRYGTILFFKHYNIPYLEINLSKSVMSYRQSRHLKKYSNKIIVGGGGAWCRFYHRQGFVERLSSLGFSMLVLPSTYESRYKIKNTIFLSRDKFESLNNMPMSEYFPDMAFFIGERFIERSQEINKKRKVGYLFRIDKESSNIHKLPTNNYDLSRGGNEFSSISLFFKKINEYSEIHTDRLHVAIAASLCEIRCHLYPNAYFKNKAIYKSSIQNVFLRTMFEDFKYLIKKT